MEKYEKPNMEVLDFQNDVILTSCTLNTCGGGTLGIVVPVVIVVMMLPVITPDKQKL